METFIQKLILSGDDQRRITSFEELSGKCCMVIFPYSNPILIKASHTNESKANRCAFKFKIHALQKELKSKVHHRTGNIYHLKTTLRKRKSDKHMATCLVTSMGGFRKHFLNKQICRVPKRNIIQRKVLSLSKAQTRAAPLRQSGRSAPSQSLTTTMNVTEGLRRNATRQTRLAQARWAQAS